MRHLGITSDDQNADLRNFEETKILKSGAFGLVLRDGYVALLCAHNEGHYELPGGKAEAGESPLQNFEREMLEEIGFKTIDHFEVGVIIERWTAHHTEAHSTLFIARASGEQRDVVLTEKEVRRGIELQWVSIRKLSDIVRSQQPTTLMGRMKHGRDSVALRTLDKMHEAQRFPELSDISAIP
jgi:8-oxo-dGTP pyrophosphatase MutT (NUDIX family)